MTRLKCFPHDDVTGLDDNDMDACNIFLVTES